MSRKLQLSANDMHNDMNLRFHPARLNRSAQEASNHRECIDRRVPRSYRSYFAPCRLKLSFATSYALDCGFYLFASNGVLLAGVAA